jgi:hypothetical protein
VQNKRATEKRTPNFIPSAVAFLMLASATIVGEGRMFGGSEYLVAAGWTACGVCFGAQYAETWWPERSWPRLLKWTALACAVSVAAVSFAT